MGLAQRNANWMQDKQGHDYGVDGGDFTLGDLYISILPWRESPEQRDAIEAQLIAQQAEATGKRWIWAYHPPPKGSPVAWNGRRDFGYDASPAWIEHFGPYMVLGGHIHNAPFYANGSWIDQVQGTWVFNSGMQINHKRNQTDPPKECTLQMSALD